MEYISHWIANKTIKTTRRRRGRSKGGRKELAKKCKSFSARNLAKGVRKKERGERGMPDENARHAKVESKRKAFCLPSRSYHSPLPITHTHTHKPGDFPRKCRTKCNRLPFLERKPNGKKLKATGLTLWRVAAWVCLPLVQRQGVGGG